MVGSGNITGECTLSATDIDCNVLLQTVSGERIELVFES